MTDAGREVFDVDDKRLVLAWVRPGRPTATAAEEFGRALAATHAAGAGRFGAAYDEATPLAPGWPDRVALHQLHPLLVHAALFGGSYAGSVRRAAETALRTAG